MGTRGIAACVVAMAMTASACSGTPEEPAVGSTTTAAAPPSTTIAAPVAGSSEGLVDALAAAGIEVVAEPGVVSGMQIWDYQVDNLRREIDEGGGYLGAQLDALAGSPGDVPFSYLIAGWLSASPTPAAEAAVGLMGRQAWDQAPSIVFPTAVLTLFAADAVLAGGEGPQAVANAILATHMQDGICSTLSNWVNSVLTHLFDSLKVQVEDDGFLGWLETVWNAAVDLAKDALGALIGALTAPVVAIIADVLAVIGTLSMVASLLRPWTVEMETSAAQTRFAVGGEADIAENVTASVDTGIEFDWPVSIRDCAAVAGLDLPDPRSAEGAEVEWTSTGLPPLGLAGQSEGTMGTENSAMFEWVTGREASDRGDALVGTVGFSITVRSNQVEELRAMLETLISGQLPVPPFGDIVAELFSQLTAPIFEELAALVQAGGAASVQVIHHAEEDEEPVTGTTGAAAVDSCVVGTWVSDTFGLPGPAGLDGTGGSGAVITIDSDGSASWNFGAMEPVVIVDDQIDVTTELHTGGGTSGTVTAMSGSWSADADTSGLEGRSVDNILGELPLAGGPGLFVGLLDGTYTCSGSILTISSLDPVEQVDITVPLHKR